MAHQAYGADRIESSIVTGVQTGPKTRIMVGFQTGSTHNLKKYFLDYNYNFLFINFFKNIVYGINPRQAGLKTRPPQQYTTVTGLAYLGQT